MSNTNEFVKTCVLFTYLPLLQAHSSPTTTAALNGVVAMAQAATNAAPSRAFTENYELKEELGK